MRLKVLLVAIPALALPPITYRYVFVAGYSYWLVDFLVRVAIPLGCLFLLNRMGIGPKTYGLHASLGGYKVDQFAALCVLCLLGFLMYVVIDGIARFFIGDAANVADPIRIPRHSAGIFAVFYYVVAASFLEEIFFRGILAIVFLTSRPSGVIVYVCVSAITFTMAHSLSDLASTISVLFLGLVAALMYVVMRNLWPLIFAHFVTDCAVIAWELGIIGSSK